MNTNRFWKTLVFAAVLGLWIAGPQVESGWAKQDDHDMSIDGTRREVVASDDHGDDHDDEHGDEQDIHAEDGEEGHSEHEGEEEKEDVVHMEDDDLKEFGVQLDKAGKGQLGLTLKVPGRVVMPTDRIAHVVPRVPGYAWEIRVGLGDRVKEGQVMAVLDSPELGQAKVGYLAALQELHLAQNDWERAKVVHGSVDRLLALLLESPDLEALESLNGTQAGRYRSLLISTYSELSFVSETHIREKALYEKKITSRDELLAAENEFKKARAEYASVRDQVAFDVKTALLQAERSADVAELSLRSFERHLHLLGVDKNSMATLAAGKEPEDQLARYKILAPFSGIVIEQHITRGEVLSDSSDAYVVADLGSIWVDLSVFPKNVNEVGKGMKAIISTGEGHTAAGKVTYVSPVVDEETRSGLARVLLPNTDGRWKPGMFVNGELVVDEVEVSVLVPQTALQNVEGRTVVFVREGEAFEPRPVVLGRTNELQAEIVSGLTTGETYVSVGAFALKAHMGKANLGDGHNH